MLRKLINKRCGFWDGWGRAEMKSPSRKMGSVKRFSADPYPGAWWIWFSRLRLRPAAARKIVSSGPSKKRSLPPGLHDTTWMNGWCRYRDLDNGDIKLYCVERASEALFYDSSLLSQSLQCVCASNNWKSKVLFKERNISLHLWFILSEREGEGRISIVL